MISSCAHLPFLVIILKKKWYVILYHFFWLQSVLLSFQVCLVNMMAILIFLHVKTQRKVIVITVFPWRKQIVWRPPAHNKYNMALLWCLIWRFCMPWWHEPAQTWPELKTYKINGPAGPKINIFKTICKRKWEFHSINAESITETDNFTRYYFDEF